MGVELIAKEAIEEVKDRLVKAYTPLKIYLFGSYAWGRPDDESDLDLLVVVEKSDQLVYRRGDIGSDALWDIKVPKDLLVYTKDEFEERAMNKANLCYKVANEGRVLYARS